MKKLAYQDYLNIVVKAIGLEHEQIIELFYTYYKETKNQNPDFALQLAKAINLYNKHFDESSQKEVCFSETEDGKIRELSSIETVLSKATINPQRLTRLTTLTKEIIKQIDRAFIQFKNKIDEEKEQINSLPAPTAKKIKWNGGPSFLGYLFDELGRNGFCDLPYTSNEKNAEFLLKIFDLEATKGTLAIELSENTNSLTPESRERIKIKSVQKTKK